MRAVAVLHKHIMNGEYSGSTSRNSGCSTAVEQIPCNRDVVGSIPAGYWALYLVLPYPTFLH